MNIRCLGGWTERAPHAPAMIGTKAPLDDQRVTDGCCDKCCIAMRVMIQCRRCKQVPTVMGICRRCENELDTQYGEPTMVLTVFRAGAEPLSCTYNGSGFIMRLREAINEPDYLGFDLQLVGVRA